MDKHLKILYRILMMAMVRRQAVANLMTWENMHILMLQEEKYKFMNDCNLVIF